jgi:predicted RNA-binding protein with PUA-like domain
MKKGDRGFFYHSNIQRAVVGNGRDRSRGPIPTRRTAEAGDWSMVDVAAREALRAPVTLLHGQRPMPLLRRWCL